MERCKFYKKRVIRLNLKLILNGEEWGEVPHESIPSLQLLCAENDLQFNLYENNQSIEIWSYLKGKKVWLSVKSDKQVKASELEEKLKSFLAPYGIQLAAAEQVTEFNDDDLYMEVSLASKETGKSSLYIGLNSRLNSIDFSKILHLYRKSIDFRGYKLISNNYRCPHLKCIVEYKKHSDELMTQLEYLLTNCVLKSFIQSRKANIFDLNLHKLVSLKNSLIPLTIQEPKSKKTDKDVKIISQDEYEQAKLRKRNKITSRESKAEVFFDYNLIPNRKTEKYTIKADFIIKNTGNVVLNNPKVCFRVDPHEKIEIGGQILPPEMSEIFSMQGEMGAEGWKYSGKDWLEKAYSTGEYWIEPIQGMELHPEETTGIEGIQFTVDNLSEQETSTILGFVYFEEENLQLSSNNKIMITF
jgi:dephospho-CoA kinase